MVSLPAERSGSPQQSGLHQAGLLPAGLQNAGLQHAGLPPAGLQAAGLLSEWGVEQGPVMQLLTGAGGYDLGGTSPEWQAAGVCTE